MKRGSSRVREKVSTHATLVISSRGTIVDVDDAACALLGYPKAELLGLHGSELVPREAQPATAASIDRMRHGEVPFRTGRLRRKDGAVLDVDVRAERLPNDLLALHVQKR